MTITSTSPRTSSSTYARRSAVLELQLAHQALDQAERADDHLIRYARAHVAALRVAAAVLASSDRQDGGGPGDAATRLATKPRPRSRQRNAWVLLAAKAPELAEWAEFFSAGAAKRAAAEAGLTRAVTAREADDLLRDAERFCTVVEVRLHLPARLDFGAAS